jgi:hypothetical protein
VTLARALKRADRNVDAGLSSFEEMQIEFGRELVDYGVALGRRWARERLILNHTKVVSSN